MSQIHWSLQEIRFAGGSIKQVWSKLCLGLKIDSGLKWDVHTHELVLSFNRKLNLLKSLYYLPRQAKLDFYFKVIIPSITYGILLWGSVGKLIWDSLGKLHLRAARIIWGYAWDMLSNEVRRLAKWRTLKLFYDIKLLSLVFNSYYQISPHQLQKLFVKRERTYNFRKMNCLRVPKLRTDYLKNSVSYRGAVLWNSLDNKLRCSTHTNYKSFIKFYKFKYSDKYI